MEIVKEESQYLRASIYLFNNAKLAYSSINYLFISKEAGSEMIHIIDRDTDKQSTPQTNNAKSTKKKITLHKKIFFKDAVSLLTHSSFRILSHQIASDSTYNFLPVPVNKAPGTAHSKYALLPYPL